jgi:hypothetical protein
MRGAHPRTAGELEAQRMKRQRRYGNSMGRGYCMLYRNGLMCPDRAVKMIGPREPTSKRLVRHHCYRSILRCRRVFDRRALAGFADPHGHEPLEARCRDPQHELPGH